MTTRISNRLQRLLLLSCLVALMAPAAARGDGSIAFNGSTSKLAHLTASVIDGDEMTICAWVYPTGSGGSGEGVVAALDETAGGVSLQHGAGSTLELKANFDMSDGEWSFPVAHDKWSAVAVTYDKSSTANDAEARVDFVDVTVTPTSPTGSLAGINLGYCVGNIAGQTQGWDGALRMFRSSIGF